MSARTYVNRVCGYEMCVVKWLIDNDHYLKQDNGKLEGGCVAVIL
ncbi:hypothetical protein [Xenorhabdus sp. PB61.4]|nr:hypothetical protein [Xenorhabdus sp. PB61.4]